MAVSSLMLPLGTAAPDFTLPSIDGDKVALDDLADADAVVVVFLSNHCPYVKHVQRGLGDLAREYSDRDVALVGICSNDMERYDDGPEALARQRDEAGFGFPYLIDQSQEVAKAYGAACTPDFFLFDGRQRLIPRTYQYSFTVERELPFSSVIEASYVGSRTIKEPMTIQLHDMSLDHFARAQQNPNEYNRQLPNPFQGILPSTTTFGVAPVVNRNVLHRRLPLFTRVQSYLNPWGAAFYDAFQMRFERREFRGRAAGALTWVLSYTFAKSLERALLDERDFEKPDPFIHQLTSIDRPSQFSFSGVWDLPFGSQRHYKLNNGFLNAVAGGWNVNWILSFYEGIPTGKPDAIFTCSSYSVQDQSPSKWFNNDRSCYQQRPPYTFRMVENRFPDIRNPAYGPQLNMAVAKTFQLSERYELQLRAESFNISNTPILDGPNTSFTDPRFGQLPIQQLNFPRQVQMGARVKF